MISGNDMTVEAALTKLSYVLGHDKLSIEEKKEVGFSFCYVTVIFIGNGTNNDLIDLVSCQTPKQVFWSYFSQQKKVLRNHFTQ